MTKSNAAVYPMEVTIEIPGLSKDISILHVTDSHLTYADERDDEAVRQWAVDKTKEFRPKGHVEGWTTLDLFSRYVALSNELRVDSTIFTGDIVDFPSRLNVELIDQAFAKLEKPFLYTLGNHDWNFPDQGTSDAEREKNYTFFRKWSDRVPGCEVLEVGGVRLLAVDNSNYQLTWEQVHFIKEQAEIGQPWLLFMHIPIYLPSLEADVRAKWHAPIMMGAPGWDPKVRAGWGVRETDESTAAFCEWVSSGQNEQLWGIFCGHVHFAHVDAFRDGRFQYVTEPAFAGGCRWIRLKPPGGTL